MRSWLLFAIALASTPAHADWQYSKWGMTAEEVLAASKGALKRCDPTSCEKQTTAKSAALLVGPYRSGSLQFTAFAYFDNATRKLDMVILNLKSPEKDTGELIRAMMGRYGEPRSKDFSAISATYSWNTPSERIFLSAIGPIQSPSYTTIQYQARVTDSSKGL
jgi:hypothetical protein